MGSSIRLFNVNDADKPRGEGTRSQRASDPGECVPETGGAPTAQAAGENGTGDAAMVRRELLDAGTPLAQSDGAEGAIERGPSMPQKLVEGGQDDRIGEEGLLPEDEEDGNEADEEAVPPAGAELIGLADFEALFERFQTPIINFVFRLVGNREQAYDLAQDVFVKAYKALAGGTRIHAGALSAWLYRIAANTATDALRRRRLIAWLPLSLFNEDRGVGSGAGSLGGEAGGRDEGFPGAASLYDGGSYNGGRFEQRVADREIVDKVLGKLPEKYSVCLLLYEHEGFSCNEIADVLKISPSAVKMRLMRARERFIALYKQEVDAP